jgi:hypothetical protein
MNGCLIHTVHTVVGRRNAGPKATSWGYPGGMQGTKHASCDFDGPFNEAGFQMSKTDGSKETVTEGSGNVFADLNLPNPDEELAKAQLLTHL